jgi:sucrose-6-phosphate hydrolase SacC (GH32 family)
VGDFDPDAGRFTAETHGLVDGGSLYATNIITDRHGRTILLGWINTRRPAEAGWNGILGLPRALSIGPDNHLRQHPIRALECLRSEFNTLGDLPVAFELPDEDPTRLLFVPAGEMPAPFEAPAADIPVPYGQKPGPRPTFGPQLEIHATLQALQARAVGVALTGTDGHVRAALAYSAQDGMLCLNNRNMFVGFRRPLEVRIFVDRGVVELFDGEGHAPIACPVTGLSEGLQIHALSWGGAAAVTNVREAEMCQT